MRTKVTIAIVPAACGARRTFSEYVTLTDRIMPSLSCPKCAGTMEAGFVVDKGARGGSVAAPEWADGVPEPSVWFGLKLSGHQRHPVTTFRCTKCGYLESYATAE